jgi:two-component system cell cycle sensor histidine kinase/response regulator CckA
MSTLHIPPEHLRAILDAIPDGIGVERDGRIVWANRGFARIYGYDDASEVVGGTLSCFVHPEDLERLADYSRRRLAGEPVPDHYQFRGLRPDGSAVEVEIFVSSYVHEGVFHVLGALRDVTERVAMARRIEQAQKLEALGTLTRGIAHDFNNLLTAVMGNITVARELILLGRDPHGALQRASMAAEKGAQLTRQLQAFTGRQQPEAVAADPAQLVRDTVELLEHTIPKGVRLHTELEDGVPAAAIPPDQLQQILMNLALNAVDAMPEGGSLVFRLAREALPDGPAYPEEELQGFVRFEVEDSGHGIPRDVLPRIFEPFYTTKPVGQGTGLGLSVVFGSVTAHGGSVDVRSWPGRGTRFMVWLPSCAAEQPEALPVENAPRDVPGSALTVLVVDDDTQVRTIFEEVLELGGYRPLAAPSGEAAVALVAQRVADGQPIHMALVDLVMPGMDGIACIERIHSLIPGLPILLCTGLDRDGRLDLMPRSPLIKVLRKPISVDALLRELSERRSLLSQ